MDKTKLTDNQNEARPNVSEGAHDRLLSDVSGSDITHDKYIGLLKLFSEKFNFEFTDVLKCMKLLNDNNFNAKSGIKFLNNIIGLCPTERDSCQKVSVSFEVGSVDFKLGDDKKLKKLIPILKELQKCGI